MSDTRLDLVHCEDIDDDRLREFRSIASWFASRLQAYRRRIIDMQSEFDRLTAERDVWKRDAGKLAESSVKAACVTRARETIDGVECERISGLDVIAPVGLIPDGEEPKEVRSCRMPFFGRWISDEVCGPSDYRPIDIDYQLRILLADKPATAPVPTWTPPASFVDGLYVIDLAGALLPSGVWTYDAVLQDLSRGLYDRPALGRWKVESGRATYLGPNQESHQ